MLEVLPEHETILNADPELQAAEHESDGDQPPPKKRRGPGKKNRMHIFIHCIFIDYFHW